MKNTLILLVLFIAILTSCNKKADHDHEHNDSAHQHDNGDHTHDEPISAQTEFIADGTESATDSIIMLPSNHPSAAQKK